MISGSMQLNNTAISPDHPDGGSPPQENLFGVDVDAQTAPELSDDKQYVSFGDNTFTEGSRAYVVAGKDGAPPEVVIRGADEPAPDGAVELKADPTTKGRYTAQLDGGGTVQVDIWVKPGADTAEASDVQSMEAGGEYSVNATYTDKSGNVNEKVKGEGGTGRSTVLQFYMGGSAGEGKKAEPS